MISVIIPTYNEQHCIKKTIHRLWERDEAALLQEVLVCDGGSTDNTVEEALAEGVTVLKCPVKGRAAQMNFGAGKASGSILYFLHADTLPPNGYTRDIAKAVQKGYSAGCYRLSFDHPNLFLKANCWFTRFDVDAFRFGDQSLFAIKEKVLETGGFCEKHLLLEDQDLVKRLKKKGRFVILPNAVSTSARKYLENGIYKTQAIFFILYALYRLGFSQKRLVNVYRKLIKQDKL